MAHSTPTVDCDVVVKVNCDRTPPQLDGTLPQLPVFDVAEGEPLRRPPLFRPEEGLLRRLSKTVMYVVLSPAIAIYIFIDNAGPITRWSCRVVGRGVDVLASAVGRGLELLTAELKAVASALGRGAASVLGSITHAANTLYEYVISPGYRMLHKYIIRPVGDGLFAAGRFAVWAMNRSVAAALSGIRWVHGNVLVPMHHAIAFGLRLVRQGTTFVANGLHRYFILPVWNGACWIVGGIWRGSCLIIGKAARGIAHGIHIVARSLHGGVLVPLYHGAVAMLRGIWKYAIVPLYQGVTLSVKWLWHAGVSVVNSMHCYLLVPLYHAGIATGHGIWQYAVMPLYYGTAATARGVAAVVGALWDGGVAFVQGVHRQLLLPLYHGMTSVGKALYGGAASVVRVISAWFIQPIGRVLRVVTSAAVGAVAAVAWAVGGVAVATAEAVGSAAVVVASAAGSIAKAVATVVYKAVLRPVGEVISSIAVATASAASAVAQECITAVSAVASAVSAAAKAISGAITGALCTVRQATQELFH
jgi:hypothetical protein